MAFVDLSSGLQNILNTNFEMFGKAVLLIFFFVVCYLYYKNFENKPSPYVFSKWIKGGLYLITKMALFLCPLSVVLLAPAVSFSTVFQLFLIFYIIAFAVISILVVGNTLYHGTNFMLDLMGLGLEDQKKNVKLVKSDINRVFGKDKGNL